jgi:hypothetical protein
VSRSWVHECLARYRAEGDLGLFPRSRRPHSSPSRVAAEVEDQIVALRKDLAGQGLDAGPHTIAWHLAGRGDPVPSVATIWRVLRRRGLITPQPQKRPRSSYTRFCADLPNERWQMDITHWQLAGGASADGTCSASEKAIDARRSRGRSTSNVAAASSPMIAGVTAANSGCAAM